MPPEDLRFDSSARTLEVNGVVVHLRPKSFDLLALLMAGKGHVVTKAEIIEQIWLGEAVSDDVITGCIRELRRALGDDFRMPRFIKTIHKIGYQFVGDLPTPPEPEAEAGPPAKEPATTAAPWRARRIWFAALWSVLVCTLIAIAAVLWGVPNRFTAHLASARESAWWRFDEASGDTASDASGRGNRGLLRGGVKRVPGVLGGAVELDGVTGFISGETVGASLPAGNGPRTIMAWIRTAIADGADRNIFHYGLAQSDPPFANFHLFLSEGRIGWGNGYGQGLLYSKRRVADGAWHHVAGDFSGAPANTATLFVDSEFDPGGHAQFVVDTRLKSRWSAGLFMNGGTPFQGTLDDLRVFNSALPHYMIQAIYRCSAPRSEIELPVPGKGYYLPVGGSEEDTLAEATDGAHPVSDGIQSRESRFAGVQFAVSDGICAAGQMRGALLPPNLIIEAEIKVPAPGSGDRLLAGPFIRSIPLAPQDSLERAGEDSLWIALGSDGEVSIRATVRPGRALARWVATDSFDPARPHRLRVEAGSGVVKASLDGALVLTHPLSPAAASAHAAGMSFCSSGKSLFSQRALIERIQVQAAP